jgi:hypothetical protein
MVTRTPESRVADNDYALGRIVEYLSGTPWWRDMAIFVTEADAHGGADHVDAHRTVLLCAGPWAKPNYVSHRNASFPALLKTVFRLLRLPPLNLYDAAAADLSDCFAASPNLARYQAIPDRPAHFRPTTSHALTERPSLLLYRSALLFPFAGRLAHN